MQTNSGAGAQKLRVLISGHLPPPMSGIGAYYQTLLGSSLPERVDLCFIDTSSRRRASSETGRWSLANLFSALADCLRFAKAAAAHRPQISHIATAFGLSFVKHSLCVALAKWTGSRVLLHPHCSFHALYERHGKIWRWYVRKTIGLCDGVIVLSNEWKGLREVLPDCRIAYLPNAIQLDDYVKVGRERIAAGTEKPGLEILYLGFLGRAKGSFDLLRAAKIVGAQRHQVVFRLVGQELTAGEMDALKAQAKSDGLESFVHIQSAVAGAEKTAALRSADIFVYPSYHEGMPMAVIEALACGLPVVATQVGGLPDLVFPSLNGLLVPAGQPDQLAAALLQLIDSPQTRSAMQRESLRLAQENFDIEKLVARLLDIYQSALAPR